MSKLLKKMIEVNHALNFVDQREYMDELYPVSNYVTKIKPDQGNQ